MFSPNVENKGDFFAVVERFHICSAAANTAYQIAPIDQRPIEKGTSNTHRRLHFVLSRHSFV